MNALVFWICSIPSAEHVHSSANGIVASYDLQISTFKSEVLEYEKKKKEQDWMDNTEHP